jgi:hypothetical protein
MPARKLIERTRMVDELRTTTVCEWTKTHRWRRVGFIVRIDRVTHEPVPNPLPSGGYSQVWVPGNFIDSPVLYTAFVHATRDRTMYGGNGRANWFTSLEDAAKDANRRVATATARYRRLAKGPGKFSER